MKTKRVGRPAHGSRPMTPTERQRAYRATQRAAGLVEVHVMLPTAVASALRAAARAAHLPAQALAATLLARALKVPARH